MLALASPALAQTPNPAVIQRPQWTVGDWWEFRGASSTWRLTVTATERTRYVLARSRTGEAIQDVAKPLRYYADLDGWITQHVETDGTMKFGGSTGSGEHTSGTDEKYEWVKFPLVLGQRWFFIAYNRSTSGRRETFDYACHTSRARCSRATTWP